MYLIGEMQRVFESNDVEYRGAKQMTLRARTGAPRKTSLKDASETADLVLLPRCA